VRPNFGKSEGFTQVARVLWGSFAGLHVGLTKYTERVLAERVPRFIGVNFL
jgi:hypothetical protein